MPYPKLWRKNPEYVEAMQLTPTNIDAAAIWCGGRKVEVEKASDPDDVYIGLDVPSLEGTMHGTIGDFVVKGSGGTFIVQLQANFVANYERVDQD